METNLNIKNGLEELFEDSKEKALKSSGDEHKNYVDSCIRISDSYNKINSTEVDYEIGIEKLIDERTAKKDDLDMRINSQIVDDEFKNKKMKWDILIGVGSMAITGLGIIVSLNFEKEGSFTSIFGRNLFSKLSKDITNKPKI